MEPRLLVWRTRLATACAAGAMVLLIVALAVQVQAAPASAHKAEPSLAALYPGLSGRASEKLKARWNVISNRTLALLLQCMESLSANLPDGAIDKCSRAIELQPTNPGAYKLRGQAHFLKGDYPHALADFDRAIRFDASDPEAYAGRGDVLRNTRSYTRAVADYSAALSLSPNESRLLNARCWTRAIAATRLDLALKDCDRAIALNTKLAQAFNSRALVYLRLNKPARSLRDYDKAVGLWPGFAAALYGRGVAQMRLGHIKAARRDIAHARRLDDDVARMYTSFGITPDGREGGNRSEECVGRKCLQTLPTPKPKPLTLPTPPELIKSAAR